MEASTFSSIIILIIILFIGNYLKKKSENLATKEDYESLLEQVKKTTKETEDIKTALAKGFWLHQQRWLLKEKYYSSLLEALNNLKLSLSERLDCYMDPGSEHLDNVINESDHYKQQTQNSIEALKTIQLLHGPAEIVLSERTNKALNDFYSANWDAKYFSMCNMEYLEKMQSVVNKAHNIILEEARSELR